MTDKKVNKREWVKSAAIIFLSVLLVLTLFSSTIMNRSLPEVAAQYVKQGVLSVQIRGSGTVTAAESFEVKSSVSRTVLSVPVEVGDEVKVGDTLVLFSDAASEELKAIQEALDAMVLAYEKAIINAADGDYEKENRDIELAREALDKSKADMELYYVAPEVLAAAESAVRKAQTELETQQTKVDTLQTQFNELTPPTNNDAAINSLEIQISAVQRDLDAARLLHLTAYNSLIAYAKEWRGIDKNSKVLEAYLDALATNFKSQLSASPTSLAVELQYKQSATTITAEDAQKMVDAYDAINPLEVKKANLNDELEVLILTQAGSSNYNYVKNQLDFAKNYLITIQNTLTISKSRLEELNEQHAKYKEAETAAAANQRNLEDLMFALAEQKKADGKMQAAEALDLAAQRKAIEAKRAELANLKTGGESSIVTSQVNGIVSAVNVSAGVSTAPDSTLMVVEVPDMGYTVSFAVTNEQSQRVRIGEPATVMYNYWGSNITATLAGIKTNPENPSTSKLLVFELGGDVQSGQQITISVGEKGSNYNAIVPNSAVRTDSNGDFVLIVEAINSALGNRYKAMRVDVQVLAKDDSESAVSGGLTTSDFVITNSSAPIESGEYVRLPD